MDQFNLALADAKASLSKLKLWLYLGWSDVQSRYKGSVLGPFWITLSLTIFILAFGFVYSNLLHQDLHSYIPFLTCGILIWTYISTVLTDSCDMFYGAKSFICQFKLPYLVHMYRILWRNILIFLHNCLVYIFVLYYFKVPLTAYTFLVIPSFLLVTFNLACTSLLLGILATRFRDIPPVIASVLQIVFFMSPITWLPSLMSGRKALIVKWNPIYYFIDIVRAPLLGKLPDPNAWWVCLFISFIMFACVVPCFALNRRKIPYWL